MYLICIYHATICIYRYTYIAILSTVYLWNLQPIFWYSIYCHLCSSIFHLFSIVIAWIFISITNPSNVCSPIVWLTQGLSPARSLGRRCPAWSERHPGSSKISRCFYDDETMSMTMIRWLCMIILIYEYMTMIIWLFNDCVYYHTHIVYTILSIYSIL